MAMTLGGTTGITWPSTTVQGDAGIGFGQTWTNVTSSRALSTTYTNSTGKSIQVAWTSTSGNNPTVTVAGLSLIHI